MSSSADSARSAARADGDSGSELVDGVPAEAHRRFHDDLPWYALPVASLCGDSGLGAYGGITCVLLLMKFLAIATATNPTVAALVLLVSCLTALTWFSVFVLVGSRNHRLLYREVPFGKILQTFWVGAVVCPVGVYAVRGVVGVALSFVPILSQVATPGDVLFGGDGTESGGSSYSAVAVAFVVAYVSAGFSEESAKYFGVARYYPERDLEAFHGPAPVPKSDPKSVDYASKLRYRRAAVTNPAFGWFAPARNPRVAVYLAFVVGLGFSFTENIQYGASVYAAATAWGEAGNVTTTRNVTIDAVMEPFVDYGDAAVADYGSYDATLGDDEEEEEETTFRETKKSLSSSPLSATRVVAVGGDAAALARLAAGRASAVGGLGEWFFRGATAPPPEGEADVEAAAVEEARRALAAAASRSRSRGTRGFSSEADWTTLPTVRTISSSAAAAMGGREGAHGGPKATLKDDEGGSPLKDDEGGSPLRDPPGGGSPLRVAGMSSAATVVPVNVTVRRRPYSEASKRGAAVSVTVLRGIMPMHAVWAGLTSTRYVRKLWLTRSPSAPSFGPGDFLACISASWVYHGTFDFAIMSAPALMAAGAAAPVIFAVVAAGFTMMVWSWVHLANATFALERDLSDAGHDAPGDGEGLPRLGICTGEDRRGCCCAFVPFAAVLCPGVAEWERRKAPSRGGYGAAASKSARGGE
jgi:RsiW-degrading membrane proteinase PrsW (M82 family)